MHSTTRDSVLAGPPQALRENLERWRLGRVLVPQPPTAQPMTYLEYLERAQPVRTRAPQRWLAGRKLARAVGERV